MESSQLETQSQIEPHTPIERTVCNFQNQNTTFVVKTRKYSQQYAQIYNARMKGVRERMEETAEKKWGIKPLVEMGNIVEGERCCIVGNIFKDMRLKPSVLKQLSEDNHLMPLPPCRKYTEDEDYVIIEDHSLRLTLLLARAEAGGLVTGIPVMALGFQEGKGRFQVEELAFASLPSPEKCMPIGEDRYVILVSGLNVGGVSTDMLSLELLIDQLNGCGGGGELMSQVCHVIIAGNLIADKYESTLRGRGRGSERNQAICTLESVSVADEYLSRLVESVQVTLMPGKNEPGNITLPQQPLYEPMFPKSTSYSTLNMATNPNLMSIDCRTILGTSGQNLDNIYKFCTTEDRLEILENTLKWGHMAPTAPETLSCYPFENSHIEPFIIREIPHIYFAANQPEFKYKYFQEYDQSTLLVLVPEFSVVKTCVMINLRNLDCQSMCFVTDMNLGRAINDIPMET